MSEPSNDRKSLAAVRRTVEEGSRHLPDRVRDLPSLAVRTTVFGVGKLLDVSDRVRTEVDRLRNGGLRRMGKRTPSDAGDVQDTRRGRETAEAPSSPADSPSPAELPVPNYEQVTIASLRGRLRNLTISDLGTLLAYERTHQDRPDVVRMYENRILKLEREQAG